jgi:hypothetical protein
MSMPRRYLLTFVATVLAASALSGVALLFQLGAPVAAEYWLHPTKIVKLHLAERVEGRKILILGGSGALFGLDSERIERATHTATVNIAMHGGLSIDYMLDYARPLLRSGDMLLLSLEYEVYARDNVNTSWFTNNVMAWDPAYFLRLPFLDQIDFARATSGGRVAAGVLAQMFGQRLRQAHGRMLPSVDAILADMRHVWRDGRHRAAVLGRYSFHHLDERGDIQGQRGTKNLRKGEHQTPTDVSARGIAEKPVWDRLQRLHDDCRRRNVRVVVVWPAIPAREAAAMGEAIDAIERHVKQIGLETLGRPRDAVFDDRLFFDTTYHLNEEGRAVRTGMVLNRLKEWLIAHDG